MNEIVAHAIDDQGRDLGTAWAVEVRHGMTTMLAAERGKLIADGVHGRHE
jgi:hypothetical protein